MKDEIKYEIASESTDDVNVRCTISTVKRKGSSRTRVKFPDVLRWLIKQGYSNIYYVGDYNLTAICEEPKTFTFSKTPPVSVPFVHLPAKELKKMGATKYSIITTTEILGKKKEEEAIIEVTEIIADEKREEEPMEITSSITYDAPLIPIHYYHDDESVQERKPKKKKNKKNKKSHSLEESNDFEN